MSLGRQTAQQSSFWVARHEMPASPGNPFYEKLNALLSLLRRVLASFFRGSWC